jgi:malate dehydrogenase
MRTVAIIGAGDLGGAIAQALAARDRAGRLLIVDAAGSAAAGKALDIRQMGAIEGFQTPLDGTDDPSRITGCAVCIVADRFGAGSSEWQGDEGATMLARLAPYLGDAPLVLAGAAQTELLVAAVRDVRIPRRRVIGSAPEALTSAVSGIVAVEAQCSPREVSLTVLGAPGRFVVPWSEASIGGYALDRVLSQVQLSRLEARTARLWPPGTYTLGMAAARVTEAILDSVRQTFSVLTMLDGEFEVRGRVGALPVLLASHGIAHVRVPTLNNRERVLLETSLGAA